MGKSRPALFRGRHYRDHVIVLCVRWYLRYCLTLRDLEELMMERGMTVDHSTIGRWVLRYAPELNKRVRRELRPPNRSWRSMKLTCASPALGRTCTALSIPPARPSISAVAQARCRCRQALLANGVVGDRLGPSACDQRRRARFLSGGHCGTAGKRGAESPVPMPPMSLLE